MECQQKNFLFISLYPNFVTTQVCNAIIVGDLNFDEWSFDYKSNISMILIGIIGFCAVASSVIGYQYGEATKVAWLEYMTIAFAFLYQIYIFININICIYL